MICNVNKVAKVGSKSELDGLQKNAYKLEKREHCAQIRTINPKVPSYSRATFRDFSLLQRYST